MLKKILLALAVIIVGIQFIRPAQNLSNDQTFNISKKYHISNEVSDILKVACNDCHSNQTTYPWYANIQPVAWFLDDHVRDGKRHLNFSDFLKRPIAIQNHKLEEIVEQTEQHEMPLSSYTYFGLHAGANLTDSQRNLLISWAKTQMDSIKAQYPADSLVMPKRKG
jgi:Haem-binding domain